MEQTKYPRPEILLDENNRPNPVFPDMDAFLQNPLKDDNFVKEYQALLERYGLDEDAADLQNLAATVDHQANQMYHILHKTLRLQKEVEELKSDTPITTQFKKEMNTRCFNIYTALGDMYIAIQDARTRIKDTCKEALQNFKEFGVTSFHRSCAAIYNIGVRFCDACAKSNEIQRKNLQDIIVRADSLEATQNIARQQRSNLTRALFGMKPKDAVEPKESPILRTIRNMAKENMDLSEDTAYNYKELSKKLAEKRDHHLKAQDREANGTQALNDMFKDAQSRTGKGARTEQKDKSRNEQTLQ